MFSPAARATRSDEWGFATAPVVAFVGRLSPEKNPLLFVHVAARVRQAMPQARFVVVGDGPLREPMEAAARAVHR